MGHSTEAPRIHPHREPHSVRVCLCVCNVCLSEKERELNQCFTSRIVLCHGTLCVGMSMYVFYEDMAKIVF